MIKTKKWLVCLFIGIALIMSYCYAGIVTERAVGQVESINEESNKEEEEKREGGQELDGQWVYPGMYEKEVLEAWGDPGYKEIEYSDGSGDRWIYYGEGVVYAVEFQDDRVIKIWKE